MPGRSSSSQRRKERQKTMPLSQNWYKKKQNYISKNQRRVLRELWPQYGVDLHFGQRLLMNEFFEKYDSKSKCVLDIGFGLGDSLIAMSKDRPDDHFIGIEIHRAGIASALERAEEKTLKNIKTIRADITMLLEGNYLLEHSIDEVCVFFPDPWPEFRDVNRRVIRNQIIDLLEPIMKEGGLLRIATDAGDYAEHIKRVMSRAEKWHLDCFEVHKAGEGSPWARERSLTKYEIKAGVEGRLIHEFIYQKI